MKKIVFTFSIEQDATIKPKMELPAAETATGERASAQPTISKWTFSGRIPVVRDSRGKGTGASKEWLKGIANIAKTIPIHETVRKRGMTSVRPIISIHPLFLFRNNVDLSGCEMSPPPLSSLPLANCLPKALRHPCRLLAGLWAVDLFCPVQNLPYVVIYNVLFMDINIFKRCILSNSKCPLDHFCPQQVTNIWFWEISRWNLNPAFSSLL